MKSFLAIDSSTSEPSLSLFIKGEHKESLNIKNQKSSALAYSLNLILKKNSIKINDFEYIAISIGPGTFTGIRVGLSLAQGLAFAAKLSIVPINLMDVLHSQLNSNDSGILAIYAYKDLAYVSNIKSDNRMIELQDINLLSNKKIYGIGLNQYKSIIDYTPLSFSSRELAEYSIKSYKALVTKNIDSIEPLYLNEYNRNIQL